MSQTDCSPLHAAFYADGASFVQSKILLNDLIAEDTRKIRLEAPGIAKNITPGQFIMVRLAGFDDPMLGRAFALYDVIRDDSDVPFAIDIVFLVHGKMTTALANRQVGDLAEIWGPLGNGSSALEAGPIDELILVAGGIGQTPFLTVGKEALGATRLGPPDHAPMKASQVTLCYGVRKESLLAGADDFRDAGMELRIASDDGSIGHHGLVTDLLKEELQRTKDKSRHVFCCGPEPMMQAVAEICLEQEVPCQVSLETPMACGIGICFSCVAKVMQPNGEWDYKRTCVEGPIFDAAKIVW